jgi:hypothetical protein
MPPDVQKSIRDPGRLAVLRRLQLLDTPSEEAFDRFTRFAARKLGVPIALVNLIDEERQYFKSAIGMGALRELPVGTGVCSHAVATAEPLVLDDAREDPRFATNPIVTEYDLVAYIGVPLATSTGHCLGTLCVVDNKPRRWQEQDLGLVRNAAGAVITEIELRLEALAADGEAIEQAAVYSMTDAARSVPELQRQIAWTTHSCLSIIEDLEAATDWDQGEDVGDLLGSLVVNIFSLSHSLWPGGKRNLDQLVAPLAEAVRPIYELGPDSPLHSSNLEWLGPARRLDPAECAHNFDPETLSLSIGGEEHSLKPLIEEIRGLWAKIAAQVDPAVQTYTPTG